MTPPRPPHRPPGWYENEEGPRALRAIGERITKIGQKLKDEGRLKIGDHEIQPPDEAYWVLRFERLPHGELALKMELQWEDGGSQPPAPGPSGDLEIE